MESVVAPVATVVQDTININNSSSNFQVSFLSFAGKLCFIYFYHFHYHYLVFAVADQGQSTMQLDLTIRGKSAVNVIGSGNRAVQGGTAASSRRRN